MGILPVSGIAHEQNAHATSLFMGLIATWFQGEDSTAPSTDGKIRKHIRASRNIVVLLTGYSRRGKQRHFTEQPGPLLLLL